ncbi:hypothetical protein TorRG33x02_344370, partial [Trema orientale]
DKALSPLKQVVKKEVVAGHEAWIS